MTCRGFLQCLLKLLNLILTLVGAAMVLYSLWMLNQWYKHAPVPPPAPAPVPDAVEIYDSIECAKAGMAALNCPRLSQAETSGNPQYQETMSFVFDQATKLEFNILPDSLPAPWFIYTFLGAGIVALLVTCLGHIAVETTSACCLSCYTLLLGLLLVVQAALTASIFFDHHWRQDIPSDPTGELDRICDFVEDNYDLCKWTGVGVLITEALALLLSLTLRAILDPRKSGYDSDDDYLPRSQRQPLLTRQATAAGGAPTNVPVENRPARSDEWSKRMREKYGLDTSEFTYNPSESRRVAQQGTPAPTDEKGRCTIM